MKRLGLVPCGIGIVGALAVLLSLFDSREEGLSIRLIHPRSSQLVDGIECGKMIVPPTLEVLEIEQDPAIAPVAEDRVVVTREEELSGEHLASIEVATTTTGPEAGQDIYLRLTDEGLAELYDLAEDYPGWQMVIVTESGEVMPLERVRRNLKKGRLAIHLDDHANRADALRIAAELRKDI
jgi:hypothetical protein